MRTTCRRHRNKWLRKSHHLFVSFNTTTVMFLLACVILFMGGGGLCMMSLPVWLPGPMFFLEGLYLWFHIPSRGGLCLWSHIPYREGLWSHVPSGGSLSTSYLPDRDPFGQRPPPKTETPMYGKERAVRILLHSCLKLLLVIIDYLILNTSQ